MYTVVVVENMSLDGVAQAPGRPDEDTRGGFHLGGWAARALADDPEAVEASLQGQRDTAGLLLGRRTYEDVLGHWLGTKEANPFAEVLSRTPKWVVSRSSGTDLAHPNSTLLPGPATESVRRLKGEGSGNLVVLGSLSLVHDLVAAGLVDRFILTTIPVVLGSGTRLFDGTPVRLQVDSITTTPTGIVVADLLSTG